MFSKALFKQSCKANGMMWAIIAFAVCFMLACVMLISGNGNIGDVKNSIQDTIITKEIDAEFKNRSVNYYLNATDGLKHFDAVFADNATDTLGYLVWLNNQPKRENFATDEQYAAAVGFWQSQKPTMATEVGKRFESDVNAWIAQMPSASGFLSTAEYMQALSEWQKASPATQENAIVVAYTDAALSTQKYATDKAVKSGENLTEESTEVQEAVGSVMYALNPNGMFDEFYLKNESAAPQDYDILSVVNNLANKDEYLNCAERVEYRKDRAQNIAALFLAGNMSEDSNADKIIKELESFGVDKKKYDSFGYDYDNLKHLSCTAVITYRNRLDYEMQLLADKKAAGEFATEQEYSDAVLAKAAELKSQVASSLLSSLPDKVSEALEEVGKADLYTLIVGSIFYKLAGLLLPIIYMIMAANNLIAGQVDSGSMAYVLSTSTKRKTVAFTQACYLIGSLLGMFLLTTATGCVCLSILKIEVELTYSKLILLNLGAFLVLFALSGLCFFTSCWFDRSKYSMGIGGGLSIFALVAAMLGLFGSKVIPSVVRLDALNNFNYTTIISLFDVISIMEGTTAFVAKFIVLAALGVVGYVVGAIKFDKKDLPL